MNLKTLILLPLIATSVSAAWAQPAKLSDSNIELLPHWRQEDTHTIQVTKNTSMESPGSNDKISNGTSRTFRYTVVDDGPNNFVINWTPLSVETLSGYPSSEDEFLQGLINMTISVKYSNTGKIIDILNKDAVKQKADHVIDSLMEAYKAEIDSYNYFWKLKGSIYDDKILMPLLLKHISYYTLPFGNTYNTKKSKATTVDYLYLCMPLKISADVVTQLNSLDDNTSICKLTQDYDTNSKILKEMFMYSKQKKSKYKSPWTLHQSITYTLNYSLSIVQRIQLTEKLDIDQTINTTTYEITLLK